MIPYNDPMPGLTMLVLLSTGLVLLSGIGLGYRLAWRHARINREYAQREPEMQAESSALEADEAAKPSETWIDKIEQEVLGHD